MYQLLRFNLLLALVAFLSLQCGKGGGGGGGVSNPCQNVTITVAGTATNTTGPGVNDGRIDASASGGTGFTFSINNGPFQSSGTFSGLAAGSYTITAKDSRGCTGTRSFTIQQGDPCAGQNFTVSATTVSATPCATTPDGSITVSTAGGGSGFTYNIDNGPFQASPTFNGLTAKNYTVGAREAGGCVKTIQVTVPPKPAGPMFSNVRSIVQANCAVSGCHVSPNPQGGIDFSVDCNIVVHRARIKVRAVDQFGTPSQMPPPPNPGLSLANRTAIVDWINAGGAFTN